MERFNVWGKIAALSFQQKIFFFGIKHNFLKSSYYSTLYLMDLFGFGPKFGPYLYAELPSYKRVK